MIITHRWPASSLAARDLAGAGTTRAAARLPERSTPQAPEETPAPTTKPGTETERLLKELRDYMDKGPIVALREKILKSMNLTEDKLKALPPEQQSAIEEDITRKIKEFLLDQKEKAQEQPAAQAKLQAYRALSEAQAQITHRTSG